MFGEQQASYPNYTSYTNPNPNPNPNPLQSHTVLNPESVVHSSGTDPYVSSYPYSHGFNGLEARPANEVDANGASRSGMISQTTDSATYENASATLNETTTVSTVMHSSGNFGVVTQHVMNDVTLTTKQNENIQTIGCEVCNVTCNSEDVLDKHKQGKKHLKNLQKLAISSVIESKMVPPGPATAPVAGGLENKKHKLLQNGASVGSLIYCDICDVVCNNQEVFGTHLAGKKHFAKATIRLANMNGLSNPAPECSAAAAQPSNGGKPDTVQPFKCELCNISCTSNELLNKHLAGKKHVKKLKESEKIPDSSTTPMENADSTKGKMVISHEGKPVSCELCGISCDTYNVLKTHLSGKKHLKKLQETEKKPDPSSTPMENLESSEGKMIISHEGDQMSCELCGISCNAYDILKTHLLGKKHQKNLEKSKILIGPNPAPGTEPPPAAPQVIGLVQDSAGDEGKIVISDGNKRKSKRSAAKDEDLEVKKQRVLEGGVASDALRTCTVCNVVCNSPAVFISHLAGQKHAAMAVKQAEGGSTGAEAEAGSTGAET